MKRVLYDPTEIVGLDGALKLGEEELRERGLHVCIDGIARRQEGDRTWVEYTFANRVGLSNCSPGA